MARLTPAQRIARAQAEISRAKAAQRSLETGQKVVIGGALLAEARENQQVRKLLIQILTARVTREADAARITALLAELNALP